MFVRQKKNKSGVVSVQVIDKSSGKYKVIKTLGSSSSISRVEMLVKEGEHWIKSQLGQAEIDLSGTQDAFDKFISNIQQVTVAGTELLLGKIFDEIGFSKIKDDLFRKLVLSRLCFPVSKVRTIDYLKKYHGIEIDEDRIYRYLDKLYNKQKDLVQQISYQHTLRILNNQMSIVFYDVTTLYFEIDDQADLRKTGFSKEGRHQNPQIVLGLLVSVGGYPLAYEIFEGNKFEGHTMLPVINAFKKKHTLDKMVVIADSGLLSSNNINDLQREGYEFILGARIKNEKQILQKQILSLKLKNGESAILKKDEHTNLVISYSLSRHKKDQANREKGLRKLEKQISSGKLTKSHINNRGYNKYLKLKGEINVEIDKEKFNADGKWDGLKGYLTNTGLNKSEVIENYSHLWRIEKAFRISKHDLKIRPIYHRLHHRIEAHVCIAFVAYKVFKELERQLYQKGARLSPEKAIDIAKTIYAIKIINPLNNEILNKTLILNDEQKYLSQLFDF
ncbi:IS1634 family transposase [Pedobacter jamesrossensis]|uniref:IS1634 family transposase n=1 Tax=Pedobacter jamesrossensis TaxID=1908238 RepID=UPI0036119319